MINRTCTFNIISKFNLRVTKCRNRKCQQTQNTIHVVIFCPFVVFVFTYNSTATRTDLRYFHRSCIREVRGEIITTKTKQTFRGAGWSIINNPQGAKKIIFTACHSGKLKLVFTSPDVISTSPKTFLKNRIDFTVLLIRIPQKRSLARQAS